eukprot:TRINITY_DN16947_c0_g1_i1.p1 TRINITY_DN16947_c0_g1~~TRINITY_DN16947_c0_g1_i1.p1  ORF type:complete len:354 (-),score=98.55 TRINITY_DN16947_c0_g1_i1:153-1214(-)
MTNFVNATNWNTACWALAAGTHPRLGRDSPVTALPCFLVAKIMRACLPTDILTNKAMAAIARGRLNTGLRCLLDVLDEDPNYIPAILGLRSLRLYKPYVGADSAPSAAALMRQAKAVSEDDLRRAEAYFADHRETSVHARFLEGCWHYFIKENYAEAVTLWEPITDCPMAMNCLGNCYCDGQGVVKDGPKGLALFSGAAARGHAAALNNVGFCYLTGCGVPGNHKKAIEMFLLAAEQGSVQALFNVAWSFENGKELPKDRKRAAELYMRAASADHVAAQLNLGILFRKGEDGVPRNLCEAQKWLARAAQYDADAKAELEAVKHEREQLEAQEQALLHDEQQPEQPHQHELLAQ